MFTSQSLRAVVQPGALTVREQRLDTVVHQLEVRGTLDEATVGELARRVDAALAGGVRWLIVDLAGAVTVADEALTALVTAARELRSRKGELIVAGAAHDVAERLAAHDAAHQPAQAATVDQAIMILKMLRPKTEIRRPQPRGKQRITSLTLPRIEPT
ncbi:MAG TPA: STAS domain-containing protein [Solirubrobacteraceae bacterium]|jgi:anti-anti-sigma regulatory factor|nr:STAS domain-containing protein [Solirubrobacteraceae bacterium]